MKFAAGPCHISGVLPRNNRSPEGGTVGGEGGTSVEGVEGGLLPRNRRSPEESTGGGGVGRGISRGDGDDEDDNKPGWPTLAAGAPSSGVRDVFTSTACVVI
jgi:hypothetical protein